MTEERPPRRLPPPLPPRRPQPSPRPIPIHPPRQDYPLRPVLQELSPHDENGQLSALRNPVAPREAQLSPETANRGREEYGRLSLQPTINNVLQTESRVYDVYRPSPQFAVNNALQPLSQGLARPLSASPAPVNDGTQFLNPGTRVRDRSASNPSRSTSAQRLPGVKDAPVIRKVLSLDGGGVRGLSTIIILKHIMKILNKKRGFEVHPWQEFDMIGGTSTGG